ncbi:MAG TPA: ABC transporter ATP-binding protein [Nitrososphaerales archaeon]|nr:ABC transporter ATP-binding protein [Nitrososphaerales archaeon]
MTSDEPLIRVKDLSFKYLGTTRRVLDSVNIEIFPKEIVLVAGHSGSGKSTLLRALNGLIPHHHAGDYEGSVVIDGLTVANTAMSELARKVGYIFQNPDNQIFMFTVERDIAFGLENLRVPPPEIRKSVDTIMDSLGIRHLALRPPHELSDGQKQRVAIAGVIAMRPKILILDEPTSLLDPFTASSMIGLVSDLRERFGMTILIVEHRLDLILRIVTRMIILDRGRVVFNDAPRAILSEVDVGRYGVTEPAIVRLAKLMGLGDNNIPIDPGSMAHRLELASS